MFKFLDRSKNQKGITIVESLVAMVVLSLGLLPTLAVISYSANISSLIRNNLIAANLAQEGVEVVRGLRDENWFAGQPNFYNGLIGSWQLDSSTNWVTNPPVSVVPATNPFIKFDPATGLYNYLIGGDTVFKRMVTVSLTANTCNCELIITSEVTWRERGGPKSLVVESRLFNWK